ncbi:hypothetical protein FQZ97_842390 [compost metagenome]
MNVVTPTIIPITLLHRVDVTNEVVENWVTPVLVDQLIQVIEYAFDSQPALRLGTVVEIDPDDGDTRVELT